ncbi:hypothetical protein ATP06_0224865 [Amycolatopsis regifaucium]|uniref:Rhodanese-related sulfurtransferase n=1 Tax=Amycolatopsis regifaucium TaxID=546365 RepID=A0ABX3DPV0_9PSEU|nr:hypothetical protein ATP06_0224865 [Amycolatopsis regifaucium]
MGDAEGARLFVSGGELNPLQFLQGWYRDQCNEDWEHEFGIRMETLDNPGWHVVVDVVDTDLEGKKFERRWSEADESRWIWAAADGESYDLTCDPLSLEKGLEWFREFAEGAAYSPPMQREK